MNLIILCLLVYPLEPYLWATCMKQLEYKYTKYRHTYLFTFLGYYGITLIKQIFIVNLHNDILNVAFCVGLAVYMVACTLILYEGNTLKKLIWVSTFFGLIFLTELSVLLVLWLPPLKLQISRAEYSTPTTTALICTLIAKILLFVVCQLVYFRKDGTLIKSLLENKEIVPLGLITILFELPASAIIKSINAEHNSVALGICTGIQSLLILLTIYVFFVISNRSRQYKYIKSELENNKRSQESLDKLAKLRHDVAGHVRTMYVFCKNKEYDYLEKYISQVYEETQVPNAIYNTPDPALSILVGDLHRKAIQLQIDFDVHIIMDKLYMKSMDTCSLIGNILNNAIESTSKLPVNDRRIHFQMLYSEGGYTIDCTNNAPLHTSFNNTTKADKANHGYGLRIIEDITRKYHGNIVKTIEPSIENRNYTRVSIIIYFPVKEILLIQNKAWMR